MLKMLIWLTRGVLRLFFGFRAYNAEVLQTPGPVLLVPNHVSWLDWLLVGVCLDWDWKFVVSRTSAETSWLHRKIMLNSRTFPIDAESAYAVKHMAEFLGAKGRLVLFAEGRLSRTGTLMKLFDGTGFLLNKTGAKVITCYLRGAYRMPYSPNREQKTLFPRVTVHFSDPQAPPHLDHASAGDVRHNLTDWLRDRLLEHQFNVEMEFGPHTVPAAIIQTARRRDNCVVLEDVQGKITFKRLAVGASLLADKFNTLLPREEKRIGVLLPNVNATPVALLGLLLLGRTPALLNYTAGSQVMQACADLADIKYVVSSRAFVERAELDLAPFAKAGVRVLFLEDIRAQITGFDKLCAALRFTFRPGSLLTEIGNPEETAVILFTSGSEAAPKGVELSHRNLLANMRQMLAVCDMQDWDRLFNALPLFHSFGLTVGTFLPLVRGLYTYLYPSPLHYRIVPAAFYERDCTILLSTNTFLNGYARKADTMDFRSLRYLFAGAEKLQEATTQTWMSKFGVRILEGYGATECGPCVSVNTPMMLRKGSAGRLLPTMEYRLEPVEGVAEGGRLFVRGPNIMKGYLNPEVNAHFKSLNGWYDTGDIVTVDPDRYIFIQGRLKRFAKISGEMISLTAVEDALAGAFAHYGLRFQVAVVSKPDPDKGETLVAVTNEPKLQLDEVRSVIRAKGLPNLAVPRELLCLKEIPKLGTGKVNHRELQNLL